MPRKCCIKNCDNSEYKNWKFSTKNVTFHLFPRNDAIRSIWYRRIEIGNNQQVSFSMSAVICSEHFKLTDFRELGSKVLLNSTAIPSVFPKSEFSQTEILCPEKEVKKEVLFEPNPLEIKLEVEDEPPSHPSTFEFITVPSSQPKTHGCGSNTINGHTSVTKVEPKHNSSNVFEMSISPIVISTPTDEFILPTPKPRIRTVRYAGDIDVNEELDHRTARSHLRLCKDKINSQAKEIYRLKLMTKRQRSVIDRLKKLLCELKRMK